MKKSDVVKKVLPLVILVVFLVSVLAVGCVSAQEAQTSPIGETPAIGEETQVQVQGSIFGSGGNFLTQRLDIWTKGVTALNDPTTRDTAGDTLKYLLLIIVIILVYSGFKFLNFPETFFLRALLSVIIGFLATFLITTNELLTTLYAYSALGVTIQIFLPLLALGAITFMIATKGNRTGILLDKVAWAIFSIYLFMKTMTVYVVTTYCTITSAAGAEKVTSSCVIKSKYLADIYALFVPKNSLHVQTILAQSWHDPTMLTTTIIIAVAVFFIMVVGGNYVTRWIQEQALASEIQATRLRKERARASEELSAEQMQK